MLQRPTTLVTAQEVGHLLQTASPAEREDFNRLQAEIVQRNADIQIAEGRWAIVDGELSTLLNTLKARYLEAQAAKRKADELAAAPPPPPSTAPGLTVEWNAVREESEATVEQAKTAKRFKRSEAEAPSS
jgi:hypothetical protein